MSHQDKPLTSLTYKQRYANYRKYFKENWKAPGWTRNAWSFTQWKRYSVSSTLPDDCKAGQPEKDPIRRGA